MTRRILFMGQKPIGERCFEILRDAENVNLEIAGVISNHTTDVWWGTNNIYKTAIDNKIPFITNAKRNNDLIHKLIVEKQINTIISVQHPWIIPKEIISLVNGFVFNLHNAKLPNYKGNNACNHAIFNGEKLYTSTIHWMVEEVDMGAVAFEETFTIEPDETAKSLYEKAYCHGISIFKTLIDCLLRDIEIPKKQIVGEGKFYPRHSLDDLKEIKDINNYEEVDKKSRACYFPYFGIAYYIFNGKKFYIAPEYSSMELNLKD